MDPYYLTLNLIDHSRSDFLLLCPMTPKARSNLRALCVMGCNPPNYGKMIVYTFPKGSFFFFGPSQVDAMIDQDTKVSGQLTLWNQLGSQVERGRIIRPARHGLHRLYPAGLPQGLGRLRIPQLKRLIICKNETVVMEPTLEEGFAKLDRPSANGPGGGSRRSAPGPANRQLLQRQKNSRPPTGARSTPMIWIDWVKSTNHLV